MRLLFPRRAWTSCLCLSLIKPLSVYRGCPTCSQRFHWTVIASTRWLPPPWGIGCLLLAGHWQRDTPQLQTILLNLSRITKLLGSHSALFTLRKEPDALFSTVLCVEVSTCQASKSCRLRLNRSAKLRAKWGSLWAVLRIGCGAEKELTFFNSMMACYLRILIWDAINRNSMVSLWDGLLWCTFCNAAIAMWLVWKITGCFFSRLCIVICRVSLSARPLIAFRCSNKAP